jgi:hypothetical protein
MTTSMAMIALVALSSLLVGLALGWYLRRVNAWCPECGDFLTCSTCGSRPTNFRRRRPDAIRR